MLERERRAIETYLSSIEVKIIQINAFIEEIAIILEKDRARQQTKNHQTRGKNGRFKK